MPYNEEPARYLHRLLQVVEEAGYDGRHYLAPQKLTREQVADPQTRITYDQYLAIVEEILRSTDIPALALRVGQRTRLVDHGILGYAFISSANLRKAFDIYSKYQKIVGPLVNVHMYQDGEDGVYVSEPARHLDPLVYPFAVESWVAESTQWRAIFVDPPLKFRVAHVAAAEPPWAGEYRRILDCPVNFGAERNEIRFPAKFLDMPFSLAEPSVAELCAHQCEEILRQMDARPDIVDDVRRVLLGKPGAMPSLDDVAYQLHLSPRTLRRRLYDAGASFREIVADVRMKLAVEYLTATALPTAEIAFLLGYSDVTAFHRSFKKLHATTPAAYRSNARRTDKQLSDRRFN